MVRKRRADRGGPVPRHGVLLVFGARRLGRPTRRLQHVPPVLRGDRRLRDAGGGRRRLVVLAAPARERTRATGDRGCRPVRAPRSSSSALAFGVVRLGAFGPGDYPPVRGDPGRDRGLPPRRQARLRVPAVGGVGLLGCGTRSALDAHTGRRIVPMCFQAETLRADDRRADLADVPTRFRWAPQRALYPDCGRAAIGSGRRSRS